MSEIKTYGPLVAHTGGDKSTPGMKLGGAYVLFSDHDKSLTVAAKLAVLSAKRTINLVLEVDQLKAAQATLKLEHAKAIAKLSTRVMDAENEIARLSEENDGLNQEVMSLQPAI